MLRGFTIVISLLALALLCTPIVAQDKPDTAPRDAVYDVSGGCHKGRIETIDEDGTVHFADGHTAAISEVACINFNTDHPLPAEALRRELIYRLVDGTAFTAKLAAWNGDRVVLRTEFAGDIVLDAKILRGVECSLGFHLPKEGRTDHDVIITAEEEIVCDVQPLKTEKDSYGKSLVCKIEYVVGGKTQSLPVGRIKGIVYRNRDPLDPAEIPEGWYANVRLINGDRFYGTLDGFADGKLRLVTRCAGMMAIERRYIAEVVFSKSLGSSTRNLLVCDFGRRKVVELDAAMQVVWSYTPPDGMMPNFATHANNGNIIIVCGNKRTVFEIDHQNNMVWKYDKQNTNYYYWNHPLANGNYLQCRRNGRGVADIVELDSQGQEIRAIAYKPSLSVFFDVIGDDQLVVYLSGQASIYFLDMQGNLIHEMRLKTYNAECVHAMPGGGFAILSFIKKQVIVFDAKRNPIGYVPVPTKDTKFFDVNDRGNIVFYEPCADGYWIKEYNIQGEKVAEWKIVRPDFTISYFGY